MRIILLEATHTRKSMQGTTDLVSVQNTKVTVPDRKVSVRADGVVEHEAMAGAVHGFDTESLVLRLEEENIILVVGVMTGHLPEFEVVHVW